MQAEIDTAAEQANLKRRVLIFAGFFAVLRATPYLLRMVRGQ